MAENGHDVRGVLEYGYETRDVSVRGLVVAGAGILLLMVVSMGVLWLYYQSTVAFEREQVVPAIAPTPQAEAPGGPELQASPVAEWETLLAQWQEEIARYAWTDREAGTAQIPIERAMAILAERGWPQVSGSGRVAPSQDRDYPRMPVSGGAPAPAWAGSGGGEPPRAGATSP